MNPNSLLTIQDLSCDQILDLLNDAKAFHSSQKDWRLPCSKALAANLFFEPSTRTHYSFLSAQLQLGMQPVDFNPEASSLAKGESLYDTVKTFEATGYDVLIIRDSHDEYYRQLENISIPIINAGDGRGNHPTQCLLDLYTIYEEFGRFEGLHVLICGDIEHSRVASSNKDALRRLGAEVRFAGPKQWEREGCPLSDFDESIEWADVVMMLRIQRERGAIAGMSDEDYLKAYGLTRERYDRMQPHAILMHPAPVNRDVEIDTALVEAPKSRIFAQMANGVLIRKAVLARAMGCPVPHEEEKQKRTSAEREQIHEKHEQTPEEKENTSL